METLRKTSYHHGNLRESIINAVARLIEKNNNTNFKLKEVAELVGTSQPAIYKHFLDKKQLLKEVAVFGYQLQSQFRDESLKKITNSPLLKIKAIGKSYIDFARLHTGYFILIKNLETNDILSSKRYQKEKERTINMVKQTVSECIEKKFFIEIDLIVAMTTLNAGALGLAHMFITKQVEQSTKDAIDSDKIFVQVFDLIISSLLSEKGKREILSITHI